jgi:hypothetical protein
MSPRKKKPELGEPGFHRDVPEQDYHRHAGSLSHSGAKTILRSPAHFAWEREHPVFKDVFDFGTAAHALVLGVGAPLVVHEYDPDKVKSPKATNAWKEQQKAVRATGGVLLTPDEYSTVQAMADKLSEHTMAMRLLSDGEPEVSAFAVDEPTGVLRRCRFDWFGPAVLTDYKTAASSEPNEFVRNAVKLKYHTQASWYLDVAADLGHSADAFAFVVQEKDPPYVVTVIELPEELVDRGRELNRRALERFRDCTESGLWPGYVPDHIVATPPAPAWAFRDEEPA